MISGKSLAGSFLISIASIIAVIGILLLLGSCCTTPVNFVAFAGGIVTTVGAITGIALILRYLFDYKSR